MTPVNTAAYDPLLARTYSEIGTDARSNHKCQGMGGLPALPGAPGGRGGGGGRGGYQLTATSIAGQMDKTESSLFDGIDTGIGALAQYAGSNPPAALTAGLAKILDEAKRAQRAFDSGDDAGTAAPVQAGLAAVRTLRSQLSSMGLGDAALFEIEFRLKTKERDYEDAVLAAHKLAFDAVADDGVVVGGQPLKVTIVAMNRGAADVNVAGVALAGFDTPGNCQAGSIRKDAAYTCSAEVHVPKDARLTTPYFADDYWKKPENSAINSFEPDVPFGLPFRPTPFRVAFRIKAGDVEVTRDLPVQYRYMKDVYSGEKRMEVQVVPAFSVRVTPPLAVVPTAARKDVAAGNLCFRDERGERRRQGRSRARIALRLEGRSSYRAGVIRTRGRIDHRAISGHCPGPGETRRVHAAGCGDSARGEREIRHRLSGGGVSAYPAAARDQARGDGAQRDRRQNCSQPQRRLYQRCRRPGAAGDRAVGRQAVLHRAG